MRVTTVTDSEGAPRTRLELSDRESDPSVEDVIRKMLELLESHIELTNQLLQAQTKASPVVVEQAVVSAAAQGRIRLRSTAKGQVITRRETIYDEGGRVAGEETVYDDGRRDATVYPRTVEAKADVPGAAVPPAGLEDEVLELVKRQARSLPELQTLTGAAMEFLKAATASLEAKGKVTYKGGEVTLIYGRASESVPGWVAQCQNMPAALSGIGRGVRLLIRATDGIDLELRCMVIHESGTRYEGKSSLFGEDGPSRERQYLWPAEFEPKPPTPWPDGVYSYTWTGTTWDIGRDSETKELAWGTFGIEPTGALRCL
jgi:hypothetical protein